MNPDLDQLSVATIRTLAMDAVQKAGSGHPGTPMALAPVAQTLGRLAVELPDIERFRQLGSECPGHPENALAATVPQVGFTPEAIVSTVSALLAPGEG